MKFPLRSLTSLPATLGLVLVFGAPPVALAQPYPNKPIKVILPFAPGSAKDLVDRFSAIALETAPGTPEALAQRTSRESLKWGKAIKDAGIEPE